MRTTWSNRPLNGHYIMNGFKSSSVHLSPQVTTNEASPVNSAEWHQPMKQMKILTAMASNRLPVGLAVAGLFLLCTTPARAAQRQALHGHVPAAVAALQPAGRLPATNRLALAIGLPLRHREELASLLERVCDPASPEYGHYLTPDQFTERFGPAEQDYQALIAFANTNGLTVAGLHSNRTLLDVSGSVADIERAFQVTMRVYRHPREARTFYAPEAEPSLGLVVPVLHISGLDNYIVPRPMSLRAGPLGNPSGARPAAGTAPGGTYMGKDFRAAYVPGVTNLTGTGQLVGLLEFDGYYLADITNYASQAGLPNVPLKTVLLDGFNGTPGSGNVEVALDIDMAISMAPGLSAVVVYEGLLADSILNRMATDNLAKQLSGSWTYSVDATTEQIFQQFAAQGQSYFNASGDYDAWVGTTYPPVPPCDDPYITIVGGTTLTMTTNAGSWVSETVWNWGVEYGSYYDGVGSGGGMSITYPIPSWQTNVSNPFNFGFTLFLVQPPSNSLIASSLTSLPIFWATFALSLVSANSSSVNGPTILSTSPGTRPGYGLTICANSVNTARTFCRFPRNLAISDSRRLPNSLVLTTTAFAGPRDLSPIRFPMLGKNTKATIAKRHASAIKNFWRLRNTENGLAIESYPSIVGGTRDELGLTSQPPRE